MRNEQIQSPKWGGIQVFIIIITASSHLEGVGLLPEEALIISESHTNPPSMIDIGASQRMAHHDGEDL